MGKQKEKRKQLELKGTEQLKKSEEPKALGSILTTTFNEIETRSLGTCPNSVPINFYDLDAMTQGLQRGSLIVLAGRPAMGKTSLSLNIAKNVAQVHNLPVCHYSLELSKEQLSYRFLSMEVGIESGRLRTGRLQEDEWPILGVGIESLGKLPIFICDKGSITAKEMLEKSQEIKEKWGNGELGLIIVDYVQMMDGPNKQSREDELSKIVLDFKKMAKALDVPIILMSQLSRDVEYRENKRPMLCDLREVEALESDADLVVMMYRDEYYDPDTCDRGITELIVCKHRNGPLGTVKMLFEPQYTRFRNLAA